MRKQGFLINHKKIGLFGDWGQYDDTETARIDWFWSGSIT